MSEVAAGRCCRAAAACPSPHRRSRQRVPALCTRARPRAAGQCRQHLHQVGVRHAHCEQGRWDRRTPCRRRRPPSAGARSRCPSDPPSPTLLGRAARRGSTPACTRYRSSDVQGPQHPTAGAEGGPSRRQPRQRPATPPSLAVHRVCKAASPQLGPCGKTHDRGGSRQPRPQRTTREQQLRRGTSMEMTGRHSSDERSDLRRGRRRGRACALCSFCQWPWPYRTRGCPIGRGRA